MYSKAIETTDFITKADIVTSSVSIKQINEMIHHMQLYIDKTDITNGSVGLLSFTDWSRYIVNSPSDKCDFFLWSLSGLEDILERVPQRMMWVT